MIFGVLFLACFVKIYFFPETYTLVNVHIWTWNRPLSLARLLAQLTSANTGNLTKFKAVNLVFHIDGGFDPRVPHVITRFFPTLTSNCTFICDTWRPGTVSIKYEKTNLGMPEVFFAQFTQSATEEYSVLLEDDLGLSIYFWDWLVWAIFLVKSTAHLGVIGASAYIPRLNEMSRSNDAFQKWNPSVSLSSDYCENGVFAYQMPCSWGSVMRTSDLVKASEYYFESLKGSFISVLDDKLEAYLWKKSWKKYMLEYILLFKKSILYLNTTPQQHSYSTNYMESGLHFDGKNELRPWHDLDYTVPLVDSKSILQKLQLDYTPSKLCHINAFLNVTRLSLR